MSTSPRTTAQAAAGALACWPVRREGSAFVIDHDSGRDVNGLLAAAGIIAESVSVELPSLEARFLELIAPEDTDDLVADR